VYLVWSHRQRSRVPATPNNHSGGHTPIHASYKHTSCMVDIVHHMRAYIHTHTYIHTCIHAYIGHTQEYANTEVDTHKNTHMRTQRPHTQTHTCLRSRKTKAEVYRAHTHTFCGVKISRVFVFVGVSIGNPHLKVANKRRRRRASA
jgi:hypothetical protein